MNRLFAAVVLAATVVQGSLGQGAEPLTRPDSKVVDAYLAAQAVKAQEAKQEKNEAELIRDLDAFLDGMGSITPELEKMTAEKIREVAKQLHGMGLRLLAFHKEYEASNKALLRVYSDAPAAFRGAGVSFRRFANEEEYGEIKADYLRLADICDALAARYQKRALGLPDEAKEVQETMKFVARTVIYLERHDVLAAAIPDLRAGAERERFLELLKKYCEGYKGLRGNLNKFYEKLKDEAMDTTLRRPAADAVVARGKRGSPPTGRDPIDGPPPDLTVLLANARRK